jgi:hypothetical protein
MNKIFNAFPITARLEYSMTVKAFLAFFLSQFFPALDVVYEVPKYSLLFTSGEWYMTYSLPCLY